MALIKSQRETLLAPLQSVSGIVERRHTLPILSNVLLEKQGEHLTFLATDIEIQITTHTQGAIGDENGAVTVGAKKLQDILRSLPEGTEISLSLDEKRLLIRAGKSRFSLQTLPADDFPRMALSEGESHSFSISQRAFRQLIGKTQYAMATQDVRYYLNGMMLLVDGKELTSVATDGHRLAFSRIEINKELPRQEMILPRKTVLELNRLLSDNEEPLNISMTNSQICFAFDNVTLVSKLIDGKFPDFERVIPNSLRHQIRLNRLQLIQAMQRAAILTIEKLRGVRVILADNTLKIIAANAEQEEAIEEIEVDYNDESIDAGFNVSYLLDMLNNVQTDEVLWSFNDAASSSLLTVPENTQFKYVVMPMRI
ncbi:DNA polymerase III subunit beta [Azonexus sp.]|uniref:DNA polymerase III subunit beta n=1 Tax=Azonexus sp. TaxID=1872668 RepID=UPI0039E3EA2A